ncbi:HipA family kinase [Vibrio cionasavignyae]|uniref:HipA family kinase n=1 Tax=Vibrio cionasavignyae TaxID=2910252 RepID=UPI003D0D3692
MIAIEKIERELKQGRTRPLLCLADDGKRYVVKGANTSRGELVKEWIVGHLALRFGLPIPPFKIAWLDDILTEYSPLNINSGYCFASEFQRNIQDVTFSQLKKLETSELKDIYMFDYWIRNNDRNLTEFGGNPNLFFEQSTKQLFVLDHNLAFDNDFDLDSHKTLHACASVGKELDLVDRQHYEQKFTDAMTVIPDAIKTLPNDWLETDTFTLDSINAEIIVRLELFKSADFWEGIK